MSTTIFLSYAREQALIAENVATRLLAAGHDVFFDRRRASLAPGANFDEEIIRNIEQRELFVFLISPDSIRQGYALTELKVRRERFPNASSGLLPVLVKSTRRGTKLPAYVTSVTILTPEGDLAAEIVYEVWKRRAAASAPDAPAAATTGATAAAFAGVPAIVAAEAIAAYKRLWQLTDVLPRWPRRADADYDEMSGLSVRLREWYFAEGGGMFLSRQAHSAYSELQEGLMAMVSGGRRGTLEDEHYEHIRLLCSALRTKLASALGAR